MTPEDLAARLRGAIGFPVTPFRDDASRSVDWDALAAHIDFMSHSELAAIVVAGGTGEFFSLSRTELCEITRTAVRVAAGRLPVLAGVGGGPVEGAEQARAAREAGVDGLLVLPPNYPSPDDEGLVAYYRTIAAAVPDVGLAVYSRAHARISPRILAGLVDVPNVIALKDGHGDVRMFLRNRLAHGDRFVWIAGTGDDLVGAYAAAGAQGFTSSVAAFDPRLAVELWALASQGRLQELDRLLVARVLPWYELRSRRPGYEVAVMKAALEAAGQRAGPVRPPLASLAPEDAADVRALARRLGLTRG